MATMYGLLFGVFFTGVCNIEGGRDCFINFFTSSRLERSGTEGSTSFLGKLTSHAVRPIRLHFVPLKVTGGVRDRILDIASAELGVREVTGHNDGPRVEEYLKYTGLSKGHQWCASFVSWCYGQAGLDVPRNAWSPALFPKARQIEKAKSQPADVFGIYGTTAKRINHVGLVNKLSNDYLITIEGNSNNRVESRRRHLRTIHGISKWLQ